MANEEIADLLSSSVQNKEKIVNDKDLQRELKKQQLQEKNQQKLMEKIKKDTEKKQKEEEKKRKEIERKKKELEKEEERKRREADKKQKEEEKRKRDEEKRVKEEERRQKEIERDEEKRKKEEERKRKEEEKRKEDEEKDKQLQKQRAILLGFFNKEKTDQDSPDNISYGLINIGTFKPIEIKKDMKISKIERIEKKIINSLKDLLSTNCDLSYYDELLTNKSGNGICQKTWPLPEPEIQLSTSTRLKSKTLSFVENLRPPYYGTWRKRSQLIAPLTPLVEDPGFFDYELDSDQEWEYESGEDIGSSDNEEDEELKEEPEDCSFLVPHGYLSEGEDIIDLDPDEEPIPSANVTNKRQLTNETRQIMIEIKEKQFQAERKQYVHQINPTVIGPCFDSSIDPNLHSNPVGGGGDTYRMICRTGEGFPINCNLLSDYDNPSNHSKIKSVPPEAVPQIIRLVHCNQMSRAKLCYEFRMFWEYYLSKKLPDVTFENDLLGKDWDEFSIGKKRFFEKLKEIADRKDGMWVVKPEVIQEYQLCCINDDPEKPCTEKWKYVSDICNIDSKKIPKKRKAENKHVNEKILKCENDDTKPLLEKSK